MVCAAFFTPQALPTTCDCLSVCPVWVGHVHLWILLCLNVSSPRSHCHHLAPLGTFSFLHGDTGDSPIRPSMSELLLSLQIGTSLGLFFFIIFKGAGHNSFSLPLDPESVTDTHSHTPSCSLSLTHMPSVALLYYTGKEVRWGEYRATEEDRKGSSDWKDRTESKKATLSTDPQNRTPHRNRGMSLANKSVFVYVGGLFFLWFDSFRVSPCT